MDAYECFKAYIKSESLPKDMEKYFIKEYPTIVYSSEGKNITAEKALDILGEYNFCEGVGRAIMHCDPISESDDGRKVFMDQK